MESSLKELSQYRLERSREDLDSAKILLQEGQFKSSINRSYYAIFHCLRAVTALDNFDSGKHSGIIAYINHKYVKEGIFEKEFSKLVNSAFRLREKADYQDFFIVSKDMAEQQIERSEKILEMVSGYLSTIIN